jgi:hypothetical protein
VLGRWDEEEHLDEKKKQIDGWSGVFMMTTGNQAVRASSIWSPESSIDFQASNTN